MTVQLHVFKSCSGVRIASKLFICAGVGVGLEREGDNNAVRLIACLQTRLLRRCSTLKHVKVLLVTKKNVRRNKGKTGAASGLAAVNPCY
jgi:hypothetical protein